MSAEGKKIFGSMMAEKVVHNCATAGPCAGGFKLLQKEAECNKER